MNTEEPNLDTSNLHQKSTEEILRLINEEDQKVASVVEKALPKIEKLVEKFVTTYRSGGNICYIGAGTSGRMGVIDASEITPTFGVPSHRVRGFVAGGEEAFAVAEGGREDDKEAGADKVKKEMSEEDLLIGISASGETPFVLGGLSQAREMGISTAAITNNNNSSVEELAETTAVVETGPEVIAGSTRMKAGTAQKMILNMISTAAMINLGKVYDNFMVDLVPANEKLEKRAVTILRKLTTKDEENIKNTLERSDNEVKTALLSLKCEVSISEARKSLQNNNGFLEPAIEELEQ
ncbi:MAG: N-acetylmuramic acid 6-phosphate etherase [Candidatus Bipolaricaulia bacterium]